LHLKEQSSGNLAYLEPTSQKVPIQRTTFTVDVLGRYICPLCKSAEQFRWAAISDDSR